MWVYDIRTGRITQALEGWIKTAAAWAPDSRRLAASIGEGYGNVHPLVLVDTDTGEVTDLKVQGADPSFSPEGDKLAYCGDFRNIGTWVRGVPASGSIFVLDLSAGSEPGAFPPWAKAPSSPAGRPTETASPTIPCAGRTWMTALAPATQCLSPLLMARRPRKR